jgi:hypothetical protein
VFWKIDRDYAAYLKNAVNLLVTEYIKLISRGVFLCAFASGSAGV